MQKPGPPARWLQWVHWMAFLFTGSTTFRRGKVVESSGAGNPEHVSFRGLRIDMIIALWLKAKHNKHLLDLL